LSRIEKLRIERSERTPATILFSAPVAQLALGLFRARQTASSPAPAIVLALILAAIAFLWLLRRRELTSLNRPVALMFATIGALSAYSALNAPFLGVMRAFAMPIFALTAAAVLNFADGAERLQLATAIVFALGLALLEIALMSDANWQKRSSKMTGYGVPAYRIPSQP
jgi:hypothetical protein